MSDDELTMDWSCIIDTSGANDVNTMSTTAISNGGTFTYSTLDSIARPNTVWTTTARSNYQFSDWSIRDSSVTSAGQMHLTGDDADVVINGQSLNDTLAAIQERIGMLVPNPAMEAEWDELQELGNRYRELEKICKEKSEIWKKLKA